MSIQNQSGLDPDFCLNPKIKFKAPSDWLLSPQIDMAVINDTVASADGVLQAMLSESGRL